MNFQEYLQEKLITFGGRAYPPFGQAVIMAGGAGSGKEFVLSNLLGIEGKVFDVDELKKLVMRMPKLVQTIKDETGQDISAFNLKDPVMVSKLHEIIGLFYHFPDRKQASVFTSAVIAPPDRKPNLIFDTTLKDIAKFDSLTRHIKELGYDSKNIHLVWVVNSFDVALKQNSERDRIVSYEVMLTTHEGAALTMRKVLALADDVSRYMDGDIWIVFNQVDVDSTLVKSSNPQTAPMFKKNTGKQGHYIIDADYIQLKQKGKPIPSFDTINNDIKQKIQQYVPKTDANWV